MDLVDALNAKAINSLANIANQLEQGMITPAQAEIGVQAIFDVSSGFITAENFDIISEFSAYLKTQKNIDFFKFFVNDSGNLFIVRLVLGSHVDVFSVDPKLQKSSLMNRIKFLDAENPFSAAREYFLSIDMIGTNLKEISLGD